MLIAVHSIGNPTNVYTMVKTLGLYAANACRHGLLCHPHA